MRKRRTKKQKIKAEERRKVSIGEHGYSIEDSSLRKTTSPTKPNTPIRAIADEKDHSYVLGETKQTTLVVMGIIVAQIVLAALIRTNVINLPF